MLLDLHPNYIERKGKKEFVLIPFEEFKKIEETLEDYEDLMHLRNGLANEAGTKGTTLSEAKKEFGIC